MRKINQAGLDLLQQFEGYRSTAYRDQGGVWTIGYGHTGPEVREGAFITHDQAVRLLADDVTLASEAVDKACATIPLTDNQFAALTCLVFNIGAGNFHASTLLKKLLTSDYLGAADQFLRWDHVDGVENDGLLRRRKAERALFLSGKVS